MPAMAWRFKSSPAHKTKEPDAFKHPATFVLHAGEDLKTLRGIL